jgi:hypothetical protein
VAPASLSTVCSEWQLSEIHVEQSLQLLFGFVRSISESGGIPEVGKDSSTLP